MKHPTTYFNNLCTAVHPLLQNEQTPQHLSQTRFSDISETDYINDLSSLINSFQSPTKHGSYCLKKINGKLECRFYFPHDLQEHASIINKDGYCQFISKDNYPLIQ